MGARLKSQCFCNFFSFGQALNKYILLFLHLRTLASLGLNGSWLILHKLYFDNI